MSNAYKYKCDICGQLFDYSKGYRRTQKGR